MIKIEELKNVQQVEFKEYVPIVVQEAMVESLANMLVAEDEFGFKNYNSVDVKVATCVAYVSLFTDIELSDDDYVNYDMLAQVGIINEIKYHNAFNEFKWMVERRIEDLMRENSLEHSMYGGINHIVMSIDNMISHVNGMLDKGDPNIIAKYLSRGIEMVAAKLPDFSKIDVMERLNGNKKNG